MTLSHPNILLPPSGEPPMAVRPDCYVVLPTYNRRHVLEHTIPSYLGMGVPMLVVDDGSTDGTATWLRSLGITVVSHPQRRGLPAARNTGLRSVTTRWVLFGEDDVVFAPNHVSMLVAEMERLPRCGVVAGSLFTATEWRLPNQRPSCDPSPLLSPFLLQSNFAADLPRPRALPSVHACALVDRALILALGGYDESFRDSAFREESDCFARVWRHGRSVWLTPSTWAIHVRHRLGGGCRGAADPIAKLRNRVSYWQNNARFVDRHWRMWQRWVPGPGPARLKWNFLLRMVSQQLKALRP